MTQPSLQQPTIERKVQNSERGIITASMEKRLTIFTTTVIILLATTGIVVFLARGYVVDFSDREIKKTGMILTQSSPQEAKIYLNENLVETTNAVLGSLPAGTHKVRIEKEGFSPWEKDISVFEGLVTEIDAFLIPTSPHLTPLTNSGIKLSSPSPQRNSIAYTTSNGKTAGLWVLNLDQSSILNLLQENPRPVARDTKEYAFSLAEEITWSPTEDKLLITLNPKGHTILDAHNGSLEESTTSAKPTTSLWEERSTTKKVEWAKKAGVPEEFLEIATDTATRWSPDRKKFLFSRDRDSYREWHVCNREKPLGVGREREYIPLKSKKDSSANVFWHSTSNHLIVKEGGCICVMEIDGSNKTEVYSGTLIGTQVIPTPDGANLIILTSFKQNADPNLYAISLR